MPILVFTGIFIAGYAFIWLIVYCVEKSKAEKRAAAKAFAESNFTLRQNVEPLLGEIKYDQGSPYNKKCPTLKINEYEADIVRLVFDMYAN